MRRLIAPLLSLALIVPVAHASDPAPAETTKTPAELAKELARKAGSVGYKVRTRQGVTVFCKTEAQVGTRFTNEKCINEAELDETVQRARDMKDNMARPAVCGNLSCSGSGN
jgi:hypothetical protein